MLRATEVMFEAGNQILQMTVPRGALHDAMIVLTGSEHRAIEFEGHLVLDRPHVAPLLRLLGHVVKDADEDTPSFAAPGESERLAEALLFRLLLTQTHNHSGLFSMRLHPAESHHVCLAADYLDAHFDRSVTLQELCRLTGISARSLQMGFQKYRGCTPLEFARLRRLERARMLLLASESATVTAVASLAGIAHLGRFSVSYRAQFGESPNETLARRWRRASAS